MTTFTQPRRSLSALFVSLLIAACGGGGGGGGGSSVSPLSQASADFAVATADIGGDSGGTSDGSGGGGVGGSAGDGGPIKRALIIAVDRNGVRKTGQTDDNGNFLINSNTAMTAPIVVKVIDAGGKVLTSVINENIAAGSFKRVMINQLTDKIVSDSLVAGVPGTDKAIDGSKIDATKIAQAVADVRASVQAALSNQGVTNTATFNPITDRYAYNGVGVDAIIDSITHSRNPVTGATELRSKLQSGTVDPATGVIQPVLVTVAAPLTTTAVLRNNSGDLTFEKLNNFVSEINYCLLSTSPGDARCNDDAAPPQAKLWTSADYKHNGKDFDEDFITLCSNADFSCVENSTFRNPVVLFTGKYSNTSTVNDLAVVEFTIRQPGTGSRVGTSTTPIEYTKIVVFKRDDTLTNAKAGNWIMHGNQRFFDWSISTNYVTLLQQNAARDNFSGVPSRVTTGIRLGFSTTRFDYANRATTRGYVPSDVYAIRVTGPGMPASGVVWVPNSANTSIFAIYSKTGTVPSAGVTVGRASNDFRLGGVVLSTGAAYPAANWPGNPSGGNLPNYADTQISFSNLGAFAQYTAEFFTTSSGIIVERSRNLAQAEDPLAYAQRPLHSLTPTLAFITPPAATATGSATVQWVRNPEAIRIESATVASQDASFVNTVYSSSVPDRNNLQPTSTSVGVNLLTPFPAFGTTPNTSREVLLQGTAGRARFTQSILYGN